MKAAERDGLPDSWHGHHPEDDRCMTQVPNDH